MCRKVLAILLLGFGCASASFLEINETTFASWPPLFALDEWSECQEPGDVYCIVDAALVSRQESSLLTLLQEYSKQTLKHYNRTLVHRGLCISRCGLQVNGSWLQAAQSCVNSSLHKYGLEAEVESVDYCSTKGEAAYGANSWGSRVLAVLCTLLAALAALATALHALAARLRTGETHAFCNKYLVAFSMKRNWEILTYDRSKPRSDDRMKDLTCVEGIRVLGMQCVIFSHVMLIHVYSYTDNPQYVEQIYDQFAWKAVLNSPLWIQAFFSISGFLTGYTVLISSAARPITALRCFVSVVSRWIRLTPVAVFALWVTMAWLPSLGAGPQWGWLVTREAQDCSERWWYHALYLHNHLPTGKFCMGHTWYLAVDMQLHILGVFLLLALARGGRARGPVLAVLLAASALAAALVTYTHRLLPIVTAQAPEVLRTMFAGSETLSLLYLPMWMNLPGYVGGLATAYLFHHVQTEGIKLNQKKWFNIVFHVSLSLGGGAVVAGAWFLSDGAEAAPRWAAALYAALDRTLVALAFNLFLLGCLAQCRSALRRALCWRALHAPGRLSYCVFVVHFIVLRLLSAAATQRTHVSILSMVSMLITTSALSYVVAVPLCLLVELPFLQLWKALSGEGAARPALPVAPLPAPLTTPLPAQPDFKPLDLLANVMRRPTV